MCLYAHQRIRAIFPFFSTPPPILESLSQFIPFETHIMQDNKRIKRDVNYIKLNSLFVYVCRSRLIFFYWVEDVMCSRLRSTNGRDQSIFISKNAQMEMLRLSRWHFSKQKQKTHYSSRFYLHHFDKQIPYPHRRLSARARLLYKAINRVLASSLNSICIIFLVSVTSNNHTIFHSMKSHDFAALFKVNAWLITTHFMTFAQPDS